MGKSRRPKDLDEGCSENRALEMEWCEACDCEVAMDSKSLSEHFDFGTKHKQKEKLYLLQSYFARQGLDYFPAGTIYYCQVCAMRLPNNVEDLQYHLEKYASRHQEGSRVQSIPLPVIGTEVFVRRSLKLVDFASTNKALNAQLVNLQRFVSPITMVESGPSPNQIFDLRGDVFTSAELNVITRIVSYLERNGRSLLRSEAKGSSRICLWGMRSAYGDTGWYTQDEDHCYGLSEDFARYVCGILKRSYPQIFEHLEGIAKAEGFDGDDGKFGGGPFTSMSTSRDFNCRPHKDQDDYGYGFVFWLREDTMPEDVVPALFTFPEAGVAFVPKHGDVLCFQPGQYLHCTRRLQKSNLLGVAFFQKCSLYRQLRELIHPGGSGTVMFVSNDGKTKTVETRKEFLKKKKQYLQHLQESTVSISDFMG